MRSLSALGLCLFLFVSIANSFGQRRFGPNPLDTLGKDPSQSLGWEILQRSRSILQSLMESTDEYSYRFQLKIMPRRSPSQYVAGAMVNSLNERGPVTRIDVLEEGSRLDDSGQAVDPRILRLLLQNGPSAFAMRSRSYLEGPPTLFDSESIFEPIASSTITTFDLLLPFIYWQKFYYEGRTTLRGRATHVFWMYPPENDETLGQRVSGVRLFIDDKFNLFFKARIFGPEENLEKTISIVGLKKVQGEWIMNEFDVRDESTKDKTRFKISSVSVGVDVPDTLFRPESLLENIFGRTFLKKEASDFEPVGAEAFQRPTG